MDAHSWQFAHAFEDLPAEARQQAAEILDLLPRPGDDLTYVHCEAGQERTGVAIACHRMAVMGWSAADVW